MSKEQSSAPIYPSMVPAAPPTAGAPVYGFHGQYEPYQPPPSYAQAMAGVTPAAPYTPQQPVLQQQHIITTVVPLGLDPCHMICPICHKEMETKTRKSPKAAAYLTGLLICLLGCFCGCCLLPCCFNECMTVHHYCSVCNNFVGASARPII